MRDYLERLMEWAEPKYRFVLETACELAVLVWRGLGWLLRAALAVLFFPPWLAVRAARRGIRALRGLRGGSS